MTHEVRVNVKGFGRYKVYSERMAAYGCYVVFPAIEYEGYSAIPCCFEKLSIRVESDASGFRWL